MKKILTIGDTHGRDCSKLFEMVGNYDKMVFVGDYVDSFTVSDGDMIENLLALIAFKKANMYKVVLLWGNHDNQYLFRGNPYMYSLVQCSGFRESMANQFHTVFADNYNLFTPVYTDVVKGETYLWTHGGLSFEAYESYFERKLTLLELVNKFQQLFDNCDGSLFKVGYARGGRDPVGSIFWADARFDFNDDLLPIHQIAGHTRVKEITVKGNEVGSITFIDTEPDSNIMKEGLETTTED